MSQTTESAHVRGALTRHVRAAIDERMKSLGLVRVGAHERAEVERTTPLVRRIALRRQRPWVSLVDTEETQHEEWAKHFSSALGRSALSLFTWDGEATVVAVRYKKGREKGRLSLLEEAYRGADGRPRAPAKAFWPWLPRKTRAATLRDGIVLVRPVPVGGTTGDAEIDAMLEAFDEEDAALDDGDDSDGIVFVNDETSVAAIAHAIGLVNPIIDPWMIEPPDEELLYR